MILTFLLAMQVPTTSLARQADEPKRFEAADSEGVQASRDHELVYLSIDAKVKGPISIPRLAAPLHSIKSLSESSEDAPADRTQFKIKPEQDRWLISWDRRPEGPTMLVLKFDDEPLLIDEVKPIRPIGDGSFFLPAHLAKTYGEKIRYEPQPNKNTVGYWTGKKDAATWAVQLDKPGRFNVAVLQGCGKGQGGSQAIMQFSIPVKDVQPEITFDVVETGHFQNFKWVQLGEVELRHAGEIEISVLPKQIKKAALMDIRAIHLIRLPD